LFHRHDPSSLCTAIDHEELWQPAWGVRTGECRRSCAKFLQELKLCHHATAIIGLQGFFPLKGQAAMGVGALEVPSGERKRLAAL